MFDKKVFSERLKSLRVAQNLSQVALGHVLDMRKSSISMMESANNAVSVEILCALADYFDVSLDYLCGRTDDPGSHKN